ncbi:hypothetical protein LL946_07890 [Knoellia locipacati]|uniref:P-loop NTPase fold protein n=1 Tax=Knoellia locipacati TaxID=882824 RepID=UPI00384D8440
MNEPPPPGSGNVSTDVALDPVVAIIEGAGHQADPRVVECAAAAAAAHAQRLEDRRADGAAVNRSTFLWALGRGDDMVRAALEQNSVRVEALQNLLGIRAEQRPLTGTYALAEDLERALRNFVEPTRGMGLMLTPWSMGVAVLQDVVANGGLLGDRLRRLGTSAEAVLATLRSLLLEASGPPDGALDFLTLMRDIPPRRFGVVLPPGEAEPRPYVPRDVDRELRRQLQEQLPVVTVVAPATSGAIRTVYEALRAERANDRVLLLHEWLEGRTGERQPRHEDIERRMVNGADVVWVRNLGELVLLHPALEGWFRSHDDITPTIVSIVRPDFEEQARGLGLLSDTAVRLGVQLSEPEQQRAERLYEGEVTAASALAAASVRRLGGVRATYAADSARAELLDEASDDLDIRADVDMIAKLIASKNVTPPLSMGLFGPWGSGKSFLMRQVRLRIADLSRRSREGVTSGAETGYLREVVPVEFNAWQYAHGTALWAALINRVFEQIQEQLSNDARYQKVLQDLADKDIGVAQARQRLEAAQAVVEDSRPAAADRVIKVVAQEHALGEDSTKQIKEGLDLDVAKQQVSDLKTEYDRLMTTGSRLRKGWATASDRRKALVFGLAVTGLALVVLCLLVPAALGQLAALATAAVSLVGAVVQVLRPVNQGLEQAVKVLRADDADKEKLQRARDELDRATKELTAARASGLAGLYGFVSDRSSAAEYRQQLGMAPMIRDDLERLAELSRRAEGIDGIDRIVIFIDDLDRCPAEEVVRVLEAVNLLFGFELFVVVVAVDSRWLMRSLLSKFSEAFDADDASAPTPQNYLEKIIQIPFWVQPMRPTGFGKLVTSLAGEVDVWQRNGSDADGDGAGGSGSADGGTRADGVDLMPGVSWPGRERGEDGHLTDALREADVAGVTPDLGQAAGVGEVPDEAVEEAEPEDLNPAALRLTSDERDLMKKFLPLVETPRAVKRFINTYQLLRVSVDDVDGFLERREFEPVLLLLALMTGTVGLSDDQIREVASMTETDFATFLNPPTGAEPEASTLPRAGWERVAAACTGLPMSTLTPVLIREWLPRVARYSFHPVEG